MSRSPAPTTARSRRPVGAGFALAAVLGALLAPGLGACRTTPDEAPPAAVDAPGEPPAGGDAAAVQAPPSDRVAPGATDPGATGTVTDTSGLAPAEGDAEAAERAAEVAAVTQVVSATFSATMGVDDPAWQDLTIRQLTTYELAALRGQPAAPADDVRVAYGTLWVVAFRTSLPVTMADLPPDNPFDGSPDGPLDASMAGPDGLTTVYYVVVPSAELGGPTRYALLSRGVLPPDATWTIEDLAATGEAP